MDPVQVSPARTASRVALLLTTLLLGACAKPGPLPEPAPEPTPAPGPVAPEGQVCCESFGFGEMMARCCETYEWTAPEACVVPADHVGGGKSVVPNEKCADVTPGG
jgi:hypothetical protein